MFTILITLHVIVSIILIILVLLQPSEGQGLSDTLGGGMAESMLGSKASSFLTKTTTVLAVIFFVISLAVTVLSIQRSKSLIGEQIPTKEQTEQTQEKENVQKEQALPAQQQTTPVQ